jgi:folate-dependent phosphoribosylglycinamide formyltransferase PurN
MAARTILNTANPKTQAIDAVKALLSWRGQAVEPLPQYVELGTGEGRCVLVLSNKRDCFYVTTARACSCPANTWNPGHPCKHQRKHFPQRQIARPAATTEPGSIRPAAGWIGPDGQRANGPVEA